MVFLGTLSLANNGKRLGVKADNNLAMLTLPASDPAGLYLAYDKGDGWFVLQSHTGAWVSFAVGQSPVAWYPVLFSASVAAWATPLSLQFLSLTQKKTKLGIGYNDSQRSADSVAIEQTNVATVTPVAIEAAAGTGVALLITGGINPNCNCLFDVTASWGGSYGSIFDVGVDTPGLAQILATKSASGLNFGCLGKACVDFSGAAFDGIDFRDTNFQGAILKGTRFSSCQLSGANFSSAKLDGATFSNCSLGLKFVGAVATRCTFAACQFAGVDFAGATFDGASFSNCALNDVNFTDLNLTGASFANCALSATNFTGAKLDGADFLASRVAGTIFDKVDLTLGTKLPTTPFADSAAERTRFRGARLPVAMLGNNWSFCDVTQAVIVGLDAFDVTGLVARYVIAPRVQLPRRNLSGCDFTGADFSESNFQGTKFNSALFYSSTLVNCLFSGCTMVEANFNRDPATPQSPASNLMGAKFSAVNLSNARMQDAKLQRAIFTSANMNEIDLTGAQLGGLDREAAASLSWAYMANVKLDRANLFGVNMPYVTLFGASTSVTQTATMEQVNLSFAYLAGIDLTAANLRGARFNGACLVNVNLSDAVLLPSASGSTVASLAGATLQGANFTGAQLDHADLSGAAVSFARGQIPVRYCDEQHHPFPLPPDSMPLRYQATLALSLQTMGPETKCPNGFTVEENTIKGDTLQQMLTAPNAPETWFAVQCGSVALENWQRR